jgi:hypothetical protein
MRRNERAQLGRGREQARPLVRLARHRLNQPVAFELPQLEPNRALAHVGIRADAVNGTTTLVYGKYNPADRLYGNGTDTVTGFLTNLDQTRTVGEDVLDLTGFGLHNTITQANLNRYLSFKTSPLTGSTVTVSLMFDHTGQGAFDLGGDTTTLVKLNAMSNTLTWNDASLWNLIQAGQVVL